MESKNLIIFELLQITLQFLQRVKKYNLLLKTDVKVFRKNTLVNSNICFHKGKKNTYENGAIPLHQL